MRRCDVIYLEDGARNVVGPRIRALRATRGWSRKTLASKCQLEGFDITAYTIYDIESQRRTINDIELVILAHIFEVTTDCLLGLNGRV